jgi:hypothetical protein
MTSAWIVADGRRRLLLREARPFVPVGVNYWPRATGPLMWRAWDEGAIADELREMRGLGLNACRSFLYLPDFFPTPERVDPTMLDRLARFLHLCQAVGIVTMPSLFVGHMSGENWDVPWREGRDFFEDAWMVEREVAYVEAVCRTGAGHPALLAWILSNELPIYARPRSGEAGRRWVERIVAAIRAADPKTPVGIGDGAWDVAGHATGFRIRDTTLLVDFHGPHAYPLETDELRHANVPSFLTALIVPWGLPTLFEEFGCSTAHVSEAHQADWYRTTLATTWLAGGCGAFAWCFSDFNLPGQRPYAHHAHELRFGVTDFRARPKPAADELRVFAEATAPTGADLSAPAPRAVIVVPSILSAEYPFTDAPIWQDDAQTALRVLLESYTLAKAAKIPIGFAWEPPVPVGPDDHVTVEPPAGIPERLRLLIAPVTGALTAMTWDALLDWTAAGGVFYWSFQAQSWCHRFEELVGTTHRLRFGLADLPPSEFALEFVARLGSFNRGDRLTYSVPQDRRSAYCPLDEPRDGGVEVVARGPDGGPALLMHRRGRGAAVFCAYPLERYLALTTDAHASEESGSPRDATHRLYAAVADLAGVARTIPDLDAPDVEAGIVDGVLWLVNLGRTTRRVGLGTELARRCGAEAIDLGPKEVTRRPCATRRQSSGARP